MKKILTILCCLLAPVLMASSVNIYNDSYTPEEVYEALLILNNQRKNSNMTLEESKKISKGTIVVRFWQAKCHPCYNMSKEIELNFVDRWQNSGVRFYQLKNDPNLSGTSAKFMKWTLGRSGGEFPVLSVFKDGVLIYEGKGYTSGVMQNLERVTLQS